MTHILAFITTSLWALVLLVGFNGIDGVRSQHVPGYPSAEQIRYYIHFPAVVLALVIAVWALAFYRKNAKALAALVIVLALLVLPAYLLFYTGGV